MQLLHAQQEKLDELKIKTFTGLIRKVRFQGTLSFRKLEGQARREPRPMCPERKLLAP